MRPEMPQLNLPAITNDIREMNGMIMIHDNLRNKFVALTPEEWVRQHFTNYLQNSLGYPVHFMANEVAITVNGRPRRADTVVYGKNLSPLAVVEYKEPFVQITQKVFDQILRYNSVFKAPYIIVSNGLQHYCCRIDNTERNVVFLKAIPPYENLSL